MRNTFFILLAALASPAAAQSACGDHAAIVERLADHWGESRRSMGLAANNSMIEIYVSEETGTWTITATTPGGPTCLIASGDAFQSYGAPIPGEDM